MGRTAEDYLKVWRNWIGYSEANGKHREIVDLYNRTKPLPRNYKVSYQDAWCNVTVSAAAIKTGIMQWKDAPFPEAVAVSEAMQHRSTNYPRYRGKNRQ